MIEDVHDGCDEATALTQPCDAMVEGDRDQEQARLRIKYGDGTVQVFRREEAFHTAPQKHVIAICWCTRVG